MPGLLSKESECKQVLQVTERAKTQHDEISL
jgi:hypothetical protein